MNNRPSDLEADDEDTQDGDSLNHLKLDVSLTELTIRNKSSVDESAIRILAEVFSLYILPEFQLNLGTF